MIDRKKLEKSVKEYNEVAKDLNLPEAKIRSIGCHDCESERSCKTIIENDDVIFLCRECFKKRIRALRKSWRGCGDEAK